MIYDFFTMQSLSSLKNIQIFCCKLISHQLPIFTFRMFSDAKYLILEADKNFPTTYVINYDLRWNVTDESFLSETSKSGNLTSRAHYINLWKTNGKPSKTDRSIETLRYIR